MSTFFQTSYAQRPDEAYLGQIANAFEPLVVRPKIASGAIKAGYGVFKDVVGVAPFTGTGRGVFPNDIGAVWHQPSPANAAPVTVLTGASAVTAQVIPAASFSEVGPFTPARAVNLTFDASTDWDPTVGTLSYLNAQGHLVSASVAIATSAVVSIPGVREIVSLTIPAQTGATGTFTVAYTPANVSLSSTAPYRFEGVAVRQVVKTTLATNDIYRFVGNNSAVLNADYVDGESVPCLQLGAIWVYSEEAVQDGSPVFLRVVKSATNVDLGAFAAQDIGGVGNFIQIPGARFVRNSTGPGVAWAHFSSLLT